MSNLEEILEKYNKNNYEFLTKLANAKRNEISTIGEIIKYEERPKLFQLIEEKKWNEVMQYCNENEEKSKLEAKGWVTRTCFSNYEVIWRRLPIHEACLRKVTIHALITLLDIYPESVQARDSHGRLPLHHACSHGASSEMILRLLLLAYPESRDIADCWGKKPPILSSQLASLSHDKKTLFENVLQKSVLYYSVKAMEMKQNSLMNKKEKEYKSNIEEIINLYETKIKSLETRIRGSGWKGGYFFQDKDNFVEMDLFYTSQDHKICSKVTSLIKDLQAKEKALQNNIQVLTKKNKNLKIVYEDALITIYDLENKVKQDSEHLLYFQKYQRFLRNVMQEEQNKHASTQNKLREATSKIEQLEDTIYAGNEKVKQMKDSQLLLLHELTAMRNKYNSLLVLNARSLAADVIQKNSEGGYLVRGIEYDEEDRHDVINSSKRMIEYQKREGSSPRYSTSSSLPTSFSGSFCSDASSFGSESYCSSLQSHDIVQSTPKWIRKPSPLFMPSILPRAPPLSSTTSLKAKPESQRPKIYRKKYNDYDNSTTNSDISISSNIPDPTTSPTFSSSTSLQDKNLDLSTSSELKTPRVRDLVQKWGDSIVSDVSDISDSKILVSSSYSSKTLESNFNNKSSTKNETNINRDGLVPNAEFSSSIIYGVKLRSTRS